MAKEKFAIIGSGPSALVCAEELLKHCAEVTMIGPDKSDTNSKFDIKNLRKFLAKDRFTKKNVYASFSRELQVNQFGTNFLETPIKGGLREIWGGVCFPQHHSERKFLLKEPSRKTTYACSKTLMYLSTVLASRPVNNDNSL